MKKVKLIWDFIGPDAYEIATHYEHHLIEFIQKHKLNTQITGIEKISDVRSQSYMVVEENEVEKVRNVLRPKRSEPYNVEKD